MNTTEPIRPLTARRRAASPSDAGHSVSTYGPPVIFLVGPWLLLALMLSRDRAAQLVPVRSTRVAS